MKNSKRSKIIAIIILIMIVKNFSQDLKILIESSLYAKTILETNCMFCFISYIFIIQSIMLILL